MTPRVGCVVLTAGGRPDDLRLGVESLLRQRGVELDVVVVGNGCDPEVPEGARVLALPTDEGIPAGRNAGAAEARGELLFFLDDDASLAADDALERVARAFEDPSIGLAQLRVAPRDGGPPRRDWVPRLRARERDRARTGDVTVVWEGAVVARREVFEAVGGWPAEFRYVHEGVDLGWKVMDAGHRVLYLGDVVALHPTTKVAPRHYSFYFGARNRVWLARRYLPWPLAALYVGVFALRNVPRLRSRRAVREAARGYRDGLRQPCGPRRTLRARTLLRMTRAGRPPIM
jgi:GT2 family glycosyltransferase